MIRAIGHISKVAAVGAISTLGSLLTPAIAAGSSGGEITQAKANASWTRGTVAGVVYWGGCAHHAEVCAWNPYATIGQGSSEGECELPERDWSSGLGEGVALAYSGGWLSGEGTSEFEIWFAALRGGPGQLLCLFVTEWSPVTGFSGSRLLDARLLAPPPPQEAEGSPPAIEEPLPAEEEEHQAEEEEPPAIEEEEPAAEEEAHEEEKPEEGLPAEAEATEAEEPTTPLTEGESPDLGDETLEPPSGEITRAQANAAWTVGYIAGTFTSGDCVMALAPASYCGWIPYATIGPGVSKSECTAPDRQWSSLGEGVALALWGGETGGAEAAVFDFPGIWLDGQDRLLCLAAVEVTEAGEYSRQLDAAMLTSPRPPSARRKPSQRND
jgi:hypothetical protein